MNKPLLNLNEAKAVEACHWCNFTRADWEQHRLKCPQDARTWEHYCLEVFRDARVSTNALIYCNNCGVLIHTTCDTIDEAIEWWNTRAPQPKAMEGETPIDSQRMAAIARGVVAKFQYAGEFEILLSEHDRMRLTGFVLEAINAANVGLKRELSEARAELRDLRKAIGLQVMNTDAAPMDRVNAIAKLL